MTVSMLGLLAAVLAALAGVAALLAVWRQGARLERLRLQGEQVLAAQRGETERLRAALADTERALGGQLGVAGGQLRLEVMTAIGEMRSSVDSRMRELREGNEAKLAAIQRTVNEQLHAAVEQQMTASFQRVTEQFAAVQKAMGDVQAVTVQIGDLKRLFGNVKTRGGWGETQVRAMLDDVLPVGAYETNWKPREGSDEAVEFAVAMPGRGLGAGEGGKVYLPVDAKFPVEDYERLLLAQDAGDAEGERAARRAMEKRVRDEARKIAEKYIVPPATVDFAVMYLPTDGLYAEIARIPGLVAEIGRLDHVMVMGPTLLPALLRTIHLGYLTVTLEQKAEQIGKLLGATRGEMQKIDKVLESLGKQAGTFSRTIASARTRTRAMDRTLRGIEAVDGAWGPAELGLEAEEDAAEG